MKKLIAFLLLLALVAVLLGGCGQRDANRHDWDRLIRIERYKDFDLYADTETGVEYLVKNGGKYWFGISPVLNADGTPVLAPNFDAREDRTS